MGRTRLYIYDLNGAITDTAKYRKAGWTDLSSRLNYSLSDKFYQKIHDLEPKAALERILRWSMTRLSEAEKQQMIAELKKRYLLDIEQMESADVRPGFTSFNQLIRRKGQMTAAISTSRHAIRIVDRLDLVLDFDAIVDARMTDDPNVVAGVIRTVLEKLEVGADEAIFISSSESGLQVAEGMGLSTALFGGNGNGERNRILSWSKATEMIGSFKEVHEQQ